jgi:uncharacterized repeat protein (TIGR01451 family)
MKKVFAPARLRMTFGSFAFIFCCALLMILTADAQTVQSIKQDPGANNPPPVGAILDLSGTPIPGGGTGIYQQYTVNFNASVLNTAITFAFRDDPAFISFANVSVVDLSAESNVNLLVNGDFSGGTYTSNGNSSAPNGWTYANVYGATSGGIVRADSACYTYIFCWYDGAVQAYDAISQTIPTNIGDTYQISFYVAENSGCSTDGGGATCNFSDISTNGDTTGLGGNGINVTVYAQAGLPAAGQTQTGTVMTGTVTDFNFNGGITNGGYDFNAELTSGSPVTAQVTAIPVSSQASCNTIVNASFPGAQCFVYQNADGNGGNLPVMFELTCPGSPGGTCGSTLNPNFQAILGSDFNFTKALNPINPTEPLVGWLKGTGPDPLHPCSGNAGNNPPLFQSNQIISFSTTGDPVGNAKGGSAGTGSCWLATYNTPYEAPSVNIVAPANGAIYTQGQATHASYTCNTVDNTGNTGPYLTVASCTATDTPGGAVAQGGQFDTSTLGSHTFTATVVDSGGNTVSQTATYNVVGPSDLAIVNLAPYSAPTGSKLTYNIVLGTFGPATAVNVVMNDVIPSGTTFSSVSGSNVACSVVNKRLSCANTAVPCTFAGGAVSCNVGTVMPLSWYSQNGAFIKLTVNVTATPGKNTTIIRDTATVSASNGDPKPGNNSSTASTTVTAPGRW